MNRVYRLAALVLVLLGGCGDSDPLFRHYLEHREAIENRDWPWIADHLSRDFLATHAGDILAADAPDQVFNQRTGFWHQATFMRLDSVVCSASSRFDPMGMSGMLDMVVTRTDGRTQRVSYTFVKEGGEWLLDGILVISQSANRGKDLPCERPLRNLAPISEQRVPVV